MSEYGSAKTHRTTRTSNPSTSAVRLWLSSGKRRSNSDTASIISHRSSYEVKKTNRLSSPPILQPEVSLQPVALIYNQSQSNSNLGDLIQSRASSDFDLATASLVNASAISDTSLEEIGGEQNQAYTTMGDRSVRQNDRAPIVDLDDRRERTRTGRNLDANSTSSRTATLAPSLFEACRELRRHGVRISFHSSLNISSSSSNSSHGTITTQGRQGVPIINNDRISVPSYPEHLFNLPPDPSLQDLCLKTALNAGASVDFVPRASNTSLSSSSTEVFTCEHCSERLADGQEWDNHASREMTYCPYCKLRTECHGLLLRHGDSCRRGRA